jgi:hypothetical protein
MTRHYATAPREREFGPLVASMDRHCSPYTLHVLCWDWWPAKRPPPHITCISREAFLRARPEYAPDRLPGPPRSTIDTVATCRWRWALDVLEHFGEPVTTLDGDIHFFASPEPVFAELGRAGMAVCPHRIPPAARGLPGVTYETHWVYGNFNSGITYWSDPAPLRAMADMTRAWSYTEVRQHPVDGRPDFGDQGALQRVAERHDAHVIAHDGFNVAPWNAHNLPIARASYADHPFIGGVPLVCWHFSSLRLNPDGSLRQLADPSYEVERAPGVVDLVYAPYLAALRAAAGGRIEAP